MLSFCRVKSHANKEKTYSLTLASFSLSMITSSEVLVEGMLALSFYRRFSSFRRKRSWSAISLQKCFPCSRSLRDCRKLSQFAISWLLSLTEWRTSGQVAAAKLRTAIQNASRLFLVMKVRLAKWNVEHLSIYHAGNRLLSLQRVAGKKRGDWRVETSSEWLEKWGQEHLH